MTVPPLWRRLWRAWCWYRAQGASRRHAGRLLLDGWRAERERRSRR